MAECEVCGNEYDKSLEISTAGATHVFDSFECAIHALAPRCEHCGCAVIGHGNEADGRLGSPTSSRSASPSRVWPSGLGE